MAPARGRRLPLALGAALVVLAVVAGAAFLVYRVWYGQSPPPAPQAPGVVRLTNPNTGGVPPPEHRVHLSDDQTVLLAVSSIDGSGGSATAHLAIVLPPAPSRFVALRRGQSTSMGGATIRVLDIYQEPDPAHDAVDVVVTAPG